MSSTYTAPIVHADIKALAAELGRPAATLIALAAGNDPFYIGGAAHQGNSRRRKNEGDASGRRFTPAKTGDTATSMRLGDPVSDAERIHDSDGGAA